jgi:hypothetical protein
MLIAFEGGRLELHDERPHKLIEAVQRVQGMQALKQEFEAFVSATRQTLAVSKKFGDRNGQAPSLQAPPLFSVETAASRVADPAVAGVVIPLSVEQSPLRRSED